MGFNTRVDAYAASGQPDKSSRLRRYPQITLVVCYGMVQAAYFAAVFFKHEFDLFDPGVLAYFAEKALADLAVLMAVVLGLASLFRRTTFPASLFAVAYLLLISVNTAVYYYGSTLLEKHHLALIEGYSVAGFTNFQSIFFVVITACLLLYLPYPLTALRGRSHWRAALSWALLAVALFGAAGARRYVNLKRRTAQLDRVIMVFRNAQLEYASQNPAAAFARSVVLPYFDESMSELVGSEQYRKFMKQHNLTSNNYETTSDPTKLAKIAAVAGVPLAASPAKPLTLLPFERVILLVTESLSLEMLHCYNNQLRTTTTEYLCSQPLRNTTFQNYRTSGSPTLQGLTVMTTSHPNYRIQRQTGNQLSLLNVLKRAGFHNVFMRSASKFYADENIVFKTWGYDEIIAREDFHADPALRKYIYGWGLEDRIMYQRAADLLSSKRHQKVFLTLLGTDTHPLNGRGTFKYLDYPAAPRGLKSLGRATKFMTAVHHMDYDIRGFVADLEKRGLMDSKTLLIVTSDHSCPPNVVTRSIPEHPTDSFGHIPLILITKQTLPPIDANRKASHLDFAPTLTHLLGLRAPRGWWGRSLFDAREPSAFVGYHNDLVRLEGPGDPQVFRLDDPATPEQESFVNLFSTVLIDPTAKAHPN